MDRHYFEETIKHLLHQNEKDETFTTALVRQLLGICQSQKPEVFFGLEGPVSSVITLLLDSHPDEVWREVSKLITTDDSKVHFYAEHLFKPDHDENYLGAGLLHALPRETYLDWVREAPAARAHVVMGWLPITMPRSDGTTTWSVDLEAYVDEFGVQPPVLDELAKRLRPLMWVGSAVPHLELFLPLLENWAQSHRLPEVRRWAREQIGHLEAMIREHRKRDEEHGAGIYHNLRYPSP